MDVVLNWIWQGVVVAAALAIILRALERARAHVRYVVCWAALLVVVVLPALPALSREFAATSPSVAAVPRTAALLAVPELWWTSITAIVALWSVWCAVWLVRGARAIAGIRRATRASVPCPHGIERRLVHWNRLREQGRCARLVLSDRIRFAAVFGYGRAPAIAVAPRILSALDPGEIDRIVVHEWAHVQRYDDVANVVQIILRACIGWHPAAWWIDRRLTAEREIACDEMVVAATGSAKSYAASLLKLAALPRMGEALPVPGALAPRDLRGRITRIVSRRPMASLSWSRVMGTSSVIGLVALTFPLTGVRLVEARFDLPGITAPFGAWTEPLGNLRVPATGEHVVDAAPTRMVSGIGTTAPLSSLRGEAATMPEDVVATTLSSVAAPIRIERGVPLTSAPPGLASTRATASLLAGVSPEAGGATSSGSGAGVQAERSEIPWTATANTAAETGIAVASGAKTAGVATAGFFTRLGRGVAGAF